MRRTSTLTFLAFSILLLALCPGLSAMVDDADLVIVKDDGAPASTPGGTVVYTITASNLGAVEEMATVTDMFPPTLTCTWTCTANAGSSCTAAGSGDISDSVTLGAAGEVAYTVTCNISPSAAGTLTNTATVTSDNPSTTDPDPSNNTSTDVNTLTPQADLSITKTDGADTSTPGGTITYTLVGSNAGPSDVVGATVADDFPDSLTCTWTCTASAGSSCTAAGSGSINDSAVNLLSGGTVTYTATCSIGSDANGALINVATITSLFADPDTTNNTATDTNTLDPSSDLSIAAAATPNPVDEGDEVMVNVTVSNSGPSDATNVVVTTTLPAGLTFGSTSGCAEDPDGVPTCTLGTVAAGADGMFTIVATAVGEGDQAVELSVASDSTDPTPGDTTTTETVVVVADVGVLEIPTLGQYGLFLMSLLLTVGASWLLRR